jgi:hypothetical protein
LDYFRAADDAAVVALMARTGGGSPVLARTPLADGVEAKWIDPVVVLGQLVAFALQVPYRLDLVGDGIVVWPDMDQVDDFQVHVNDDGSVDILEEGYDGPTVTALPELVGDALAGITDAQLSRLAARWAQIEEFSHFDDMSLTLLPVLTELVALARRAADAGDRLYLWATTA